MFVPLLVKLLGALFLGTGLLTLQHPEVPKSALPAVGIVLVEHSNSAQTSGTVFVAGDHLLVTADHVVQKADHILVRFRETDWLEANVVESDPINDVAVLSYSGPDIPALPLADFGKVKPGDYVAVMAFPSVEELRKQPQAKDVQEKAAKAQTAVEGTVRAIRGALLVITTEDVPRNGGPVLNLAGEVMGVVRGRLQTDMATGLGYAAPSYTIKPTLAAAELKHPSEPTPSVQTTAQSPGGSTPGPSQPASSAPSQPATSVPSPAGQAPSQPAAAAPSQPAGQVPPQAASPGPSQPAVPATPQLVPSASSSAAVAPFLIVPGQSVGPVRLGMPVREETARLGASKGSVELDDGTMMYRWFEPPSNSGIGVRTAKNDTVLRVWVLNDERYSTKEGLHVGSTEAQVRAALGVPTRVEFSSKAKTRTLIYEALGLWFSIQLDQQYNFYNAVFDIGVMAKK